ncbi:hypothetical protein Vafri_2539 [Volvox africanus]|uniref:Uncharacterized protein n=1 Tax=Volvox africanus TaxID=51714 RepID=A0A8J4ETQ6_9CHLO|nr:hypothetical protein Vafri_2539 [Volvox africanus]
MDSINKFLLENLILLLLLLQAFASRPNRVPHQVPIGGTRLVEQAMTLKASSLNLLQSPPVPFQLKSDFSVASSSRLPSEKISTKRRGLIQVREAAADQPAVRHLGRPDEDSLEILLCRHFDIVFRITSCSHSSSKTHNATAPTQMVTHGSFAKSQGFGAVHPDRSPRRRDDAEASAVTEAPTEHGQVHRRARRKHEAAICLWSYRLAVASHSDRIGDGGGGSGRSREDSAASNSSTADSGSIAGQREEGEDGEEEERGEKEAEAAAAGRQRLMRRLVGKVWPDGQTWDSKDARSLSLPPPPPQQQEQEQEQRRRRQRQELRRHRSGATRLLHAEDPPFAAGAAEVMKTSGDGFHDNVVLTEQDLMPHNSVWPREALAYKAHLTALRLCGKLLPPAPEMESLKQQPEDGAILRELDVAVSVAPPPPPPPAVVHSRSDWGSRGGACAIITDDVRWVAAADSGALERSLRREGTSGAAAVVAAAAAAATAGSKTLQQAVFVGRDLAELNATVSDLVDPVALQSDAESKRPLLGVLPWGRCREDASYSGGGSGGGGAAAVSTCTGVYTSRESWLADLKDGLANMQRQEASTAAAAVTDSYGNVRPAVQVPLGDSGGGNGILAGSWDVVALPSACAGWGIGGADVRSGIGGADVRSGIGGANPDSAVIGATATADGRRNTARGGGQRRRGKGDMDDSKSGMRISANSHRPMGHTRVPFLPSPLYGMAGCILAFSATAAAALDLLAARTIPYNYTEDIFNASSDSATTANRLNGSLQRLTAGTGTNGKPLHSYSLLPVINSPFFAKLSLLSRQGVLSLGVATSPSQLVTAAATEVTSTSMEADGSFAPGSAPPYRRRFLLFTCAGDQGIWRMWAHPKRNFDLLVAYYGAMDLADPRVSGSAAAGGGRPDYVYRAHGSKHQNLHRLNSLYPGLLDSYDIVAVWDDDLASSAAHVSDMFERFGELMTHRPDNPDRVWLGQPSLKYGSKVDHILLAHQPTLRMSYTSFVENNACVFRSDKLRELLDSPGYSGELMGWGVDYAYLAALGPKVQNRFVVLHDFQVLNPPSAAKAEGREILKLASQEVRIRQWNSYKAKFRIEVEPEVAYKCVPVRHDLPPERYPRYCPEYRPPPMEAVRRTGASLPMQLRAEQALKRVSFVIRKFGIGGDDDGGDGGRQGSWDSKQTSSGGWLGIALEDGARERRQILLR